MSSTQSDIGPFPLGSVIESANFKGKTWLEMLAFDPLFNCPIGNVTFEAGSRNCWHKHPGGQILLVTGGEGLYQERGMPARRLRAGDVVQILPDIEHWHGAAPDSRFAHIAITTNPQHGEPAWLEPVSDEDYAAAAKQGAQHGGRRE